MKIVGELFQDRQTAVPLIGIFPWGVINGRDDLAGQRGGTMSYTRKPPTREGAPLNKYHTHFLLVDDGKVGGVAWGSEIGFRSAMEKELAACSGTLIQIVIQGGPGTLATVLATAQVGTPIIVLTEAGGAATAMCDFFTGGIDKVAEVFKAHVEKLAAIKAAIDEAVSRGSQLVYMWSSKSKDSLVVTMRMAVGNSTLYAPGGGDGGPSATVNERNHIGLALCSAVNWNQPDDVKAVMKLCSKEFLLRAFYLARKKVRGPPARPAPGAQEGAAGRGGQASAAPRSMVGGKGRDGGRGCWVEGRRRGLAEVHRISWAG